MHAIRDSIKLTLFFTIVCSSAMAAAQGAPPPLPGAAAADALYREKDWGKAAVAYRALTRVDSTRPMLWVRLATAEYQLGLFRDAARDFRRAAVITSNPLHYFNVVASLARANDVDGAFEAFEPALAAGFSDVSALLNDDDLAVLRSTVRFDAILSRTKANAMPCSVQPESRWFDFWVGEWDVRTPQGDLAGSSSVTLQLGNCAVYEQWAPRAGSAGKSFSAFNPTRKLWQQFYVTDRGEVNEFLGHRIDHGMRFDALVVDTIGDERRRMTLTLLDGGDVRQLGERSSDRGTHWIVEYDLRYRKKTP